MQDEQKQIEEMAKVMQKDFCDGFADNRGCCLSRSYNNNCIDCRKVFADETNDYAEILYAAGYRKQSEVIDEFVERLKEENEISLRRYGKGIRMTAIFKIADEMKFELFKQQEDKNER